MVVEYEYLICNEYGDVLFAYGNEEDALTQCYKTEGYSISRQPIEEAKDEQNS